MALASTDLPLARLARPRPQLRTAISAPAASGRTAILAPAVTGRPGHSATSALAAPAPAPSPAMYLTVFAGWLLALAWFHPRLAGLLDLATGPLGWAALAFFVLFTEVAWLYAAFNLGVILFALRYRRRHAPAELLRAAAPHVTARPPVAVLYTTCNDFVEASAASCLAQDYPAFTVYLLDDSCDPAWRARVDAFAAAHPGRARVIRRGDRRGFKAGNLNHALARLDEPLFALADADELLPHRLPLPAGAAPAGRPGLRLRPGRPPRQPGRAEPLRPPARPGHRHPLALVPAAAQPLRLRHAARPRRAAPARGLGGGGRLPGAGERGPGLRAPAPREQGWRGRFAEDVICHEDFPDDMRAFRVRHMKWTRGTCEFLWKEMRRLVLSPRIPLVEKLDVLFPTLNLPLSLAFFLFILDANVLLPALFGRSQPLTLALGGLELALPTVALDPAFGAVMTADFFAITVLTLLAPVLCFVVDGWRRPRRLLRFLAGSTATYGTLGPLSSVGVLLYAATGKAVFHVTADRGAAAGAPRAAGAAAGPPGRQPPGPAPGAGLRDGLRRRLRPDLPGHRPGLVPRPLARLPAPAGGPPPRLGRRAHGDPELAPLRLRRPGARARRPVAPRASSRSCSGSGSTSDRGAGRGCRRALDPRPRHRSDAGGRPDAGDARWLWSSLVVEAVLAPVLAASSANMAAVTVTEWAWVAVPMMS